VARWSGILLCGVTVWSAPPVLAQGPQRDTLPSSARIPAVPATLARLRGWMPLATTGVPQFLASHPAWDGRGVLIAILDSGIDPGVEGLTTTSTGAPKLLDLRDFSGEGAIPLAPLTPRGDTLIASGHRFLGMNRIRSVTTGPWFGGFFRERPLGPLPASDVNDDLDNSDSLLVVVGRVPEGWALFADTDGDGSFANEKPVRDFLIGRETFGWHRPGSATPLTIGVNFSESRDGAPGLHLVFDTEAHGTHVAGIAAGKSIGGLPGFDGVAPGAQVLGLKISRNDLGGITTTGSVVAALDYAIRFAARRSLPLVVNMSFGVGNEREGSARLDVLLDSMLAAHPNVVFVTSAGNDGPGLSTMGFPGSARRAITVGAVQASAFVPGGTTGSEPLLYFSSRGGELAKPDVVAPGTAYSTVPGWNVGDEFKSGTSMAAPHVAGLVALLLSAAGAPARGPTAEEIRHALIESARRVPGGAMVDAGAGIPAIDGAARILQGPPPPARFAVDLPDRPGATAAFAIGPAPGEIAFRITRTYGTAPVDLVLTSDVSWLTAPSRVTLADPVTILPVRQTPPRTPGTYSGSIRATPVGLSATAFVLVSTVVVPHQTSAIGFSTRARLDAAGGARVSFAADSGRPFQVRIEAGSRDQPLVASLHQPGGQPILGDNGIPAGMDSLAASFDVDGRDALAGYYEAIATAPPDRPAAARVTVRHAPGRLELSAQGDSLTARLISLTDSATSGILRLGLLGAQREIQIDTSGSEDIHVRVPVPSWATELVADLEFDRLQWPRFTDFGFAAMDPEGEVLEKEPANYARTRLVLPLGSPSMPQNLDLVLAPGFADPGSAERWKARLTVRWIAREPSILAAREADELQLQPRGSKELHARVGTLPWSLPEGFRPLLLFRLESGGTGWTWQMPLSR
jgi:subtilisin family serine protease